MINNCNDQSPSRRTFKRLPKPLGLGMCVFDIVMLKIQGVLLNTQSRPFQSVLRPLDMVTKPHTRGMTNWAFVAN